LELGFEIADIILTEFGGLLAAVQFRIMYSVSQLKSYSRLYNTRLSEFNAPHMSMIINSSSP
jgi:hypothetical protein